MSEIVPWTRSHITPHGLVDVFNPRNKIPLRTKIAVGVGIVVTSVPTLVTADIIYSDITTPNIGPKLELAEKSIPCENADAVVPVVAGYGIENSEYSAKGIAQIGNKKNWCTVWVTNGTGVFIHQVSELIGDVALKSRQAQIAADPTKKPNVIMFGMSAGGIETALVENDMIQTYGDKINFPAKVDDSSPGGGSDILWIDQGLAKESARHCELLSFGDVVMTAATLEGDPERKDKFFENWDQIYKLTKDASIKKRRAQTCMIRDGYPAINKEAMTHVFYVRVKDPSRDFIVNVVTAEKAIREKSNGLFKAVYVTGPNVQHAASWRYFAEYEPFYRDIMDRIDTIIKAREEKKWYVNSELPQPR